MSEQSVTQWIQGLKQGEHEAARQLWERYFASLVRVARKRLGGAPRRACDEEDVAASVFESLCAGAARGAFPRLEDRDDLWYLLLAITRRKAVSQVRRTGSGKRGGGLVYAESELDAATAGGGFTMDELASTAPTPEFIAVLDEEHQRLMGLLRDDTLRQIAVGRMEGRTNVEIAELLGISRQAVQRKHALIRETWLRELEP